MDMNGGSTAYYVGYQVSILARLTDSNGSVASSAIMTVTTDDASQNIVVNRAFGISNNQPYYLFTYTPKAAGGHTITISALGATKSITLTSPPIITETVGVTADSSQPPAGNIISGSIQQLLAGFRFRETSGLEDVAFDGFTVNDSVSPTTAPPLKNLSVCNGQGNPIFSGITSDGYAYTFGFGSGRRIPKANAISFMICGDVPTSTQEIGSVHTLSIENASSVNAGYYPPASSLTINLDNATGNPQTVVSQ
jgi:hypothetical protein